LILLECKDITKFFPGVTALNHVSISFNRAEIHALVGENGAGKSTLIKIIAGKYRPDTGEIYLKGKKVQMTEPRKAIEQGISTVFQEYNLLPHLRIIENIILGNEPVGKKDRIDWQKARAICIQLMENLQINIDLDLYAGDLGAAEAKMVEILKALVSKAEIIIMDEPTAALPEKEVEALFRLIYNLKASGVTVIYISHRINEIFSIADRVSVLKDGKIVGTFLVNTINQDELIRLMVGREISSTFPYRHNFQDNPVVLSLRNIEDQRRHLKGISFDLRQGEILAIGGMTGNGQREIIRFLFGSYPISKGEVYYEGKKVSIRSPRDALHLGIGFIPDDRRNEGLAVTQSVRKNIALPSLHLRQSIGFIHRRKEKEIVEKMVSTLNILVPMISTPVQNLSGGNQQRVVIAKWLPLKPKVLLFHEPTLGVDVGAKMGIYQLMRQFADEGVAILMVTGDMIELLRIPDRILVFFEGKITGEFFRQNATEEEIMFAASGQKEV
jgi:ribose transport system ATP-binding protein